MALSRRTYYLFGVFILSGVVCTTVGRALNKTSAPGWGGEKSVFEKPFSTTFFMFMAEMFAYPCYMVRNRMEGKPILPKRTLKQFLYPAVPAAFDFAACTLINYGVLWVTASVSSILYGSQVVFTAIITIILLKKKIYVFEWVAVGVMVVGLVMIACSTIEGHTLNEDITQFKKVLGVVLSLIGQLVSAAQAVLLEYYMTDVEPIELVGLEGVYGVLANIIVIGPVIYFIPGSEKSTNKNGSLENYLDTFIKLAQWDVLLLTIAYIVSKCVYNIYAVLVIDDTSAVNFSVLTNIVSLFVWIVGLIFGLWEDKFTWAEKWDNKWSWLQVAGYILIVLSSSMYNRVFELRFFTYPKDDTKPLNPAKGSVSAENMDDNEEDTKDSV